MLSEKYETHLNADNIVQAARRVWAGADVLSEWAVLRRDQILADRVGDYRSTGAASRIRELAGLPDSREYYPMEDRIADQIRSAYDPTSLPPGPSAPLEELAAASAEQVRICAGACLGGPGPSPDQTARYVRAWGGTRAVLIPGSTKN